MYEYEGQFHNYLHMFMRGEVDYDSYPDYLMEWQQHIRSNPDIPVHIVYYEKLHEDCVGELSRLREFLALDVDDGLIQEISHNCSFNNLRENKRKAMTHERAAHLERMLKPGFNPFRKGRVGDWKSWFTVSQSEMFDTWWTYKTKGLDMFNFTFETKVFDVRVLTDKMPRHKFYDVPGGDTMTLDVVDVSTGYRQTSFMMPEGVRDGFFRDIKNVNIRDDDVLFCSYPKTGSTWLLEMVTMMKNKSTQLVQGNRLDGMIESKPPATLQDMTSPRLLNTHIKVRYLPTEAVEKKIKTVFLYRNPKDVAVSFYHHAKGIKTYEYGGKFENYLQMFMRGEVDYGSYPEYLLEWQEHIRTNPDIPVHILNYEDLKEDCFTELKKLRDFLEYDAADDLVAEIADFCSMDKLKAYKQQHATPEVIKLSKMFMDEGFDFMRKGEIGDWRNWLTVAQNEVFDTWWKQETRGLDMFKFRYTNTYRQLTWQGTTMLEVTSF